jgi:transcriptional regulator with XRE-family HTH domain
MAVNEADEKALKEVLRDVTAIHRILDKLVKARKSKKITVREVAEKLGCSQATVRAFESEMSDPKLSMIMRYARLVGFDVAVLLPPRDNL